VAEKRNVSLYNVAAGVTAGGELIMKAYQWREIFWRKRPQWRNNNGEKQLSMAESGMQRKAKLAQWRIEEMAAYGGGGSEAAANIESLSSAIWLCKAGQLHLAQLSIVFVAASAALCGYICSVMWRMAGMISGDMAPRRAGCAYGGSGAAGAPPAWLRRGADGSQHGALRVAASASEAWQTGEASAAAARQRQRRGNMAINVA
jgi:hypothetical protein